jgi:hypothetical protein
MVDELLNNDPVVGEVYAPLVGGEVQSTTNGKNAAVQQFDNIQEKRNQPVFSLLTEVAYFSIELFQKFCKIYLCNCNKPRRPITYA